jgi:hypothetical protein
VLGRRLQLRDATDAGRQAVARLAAGGTGVITPLQITSPKLQALAIIKGSVARGVRWWYICARTRVPAGPLAHSRTRCFQLPL